MLYFFDEVRYYQPVKDPTLASPFPSEFYRFETPAPLEYDIARFTRMIRDLKGHEDEYYRGLISSLAARPHENNLPSLWSIVADITGGAASARTDNNLDRQKLWQARLILKLAEILADDEKEISATLDGVRRQQAELLRNLRGEADMDDDRGEAAELYSAQIPEPAPLTMNVRLLTRAWAELFVHGQKPVWQVTATHPDAATAVLETYAKKMAKKPVRLLSLPVPHQDRGLTDDQFISQRGDFLKLVADSRMLIHQTLVRVADGSLTPAESSELLATEAAKWSDALPKTAGEQKNAALHFYLLEGMSLGAIFSALSFDNATIHASGPPHGLVAVLEGAS